MAAPEAESRGLGWPLNVILLAVLAVPAFSGYPLAGMQAQIVAGVRWSWVVYFGCVHAVTVLVLGRRLHANILAAAALITLPVVYFGAAISWAGFHLGLSAMGPAGFGGHYARLCLTLLTVVPLALALVSVIPFGRMEHGLLLRAGGVTPLQKKILMAMRVFNHIAFFVLPSTLEVLREERPATHWRSQWRARHLPRGALLRELAGHLIHLSVEIISASLQYVPLWAHEIARLPEPCQRETAFGKEH